MNAADRITEIRATPVRVPVTRAGTMSGAKRTHAARTLVEVVVEDGTVGLGETRTEEAAAIIAGRFAPALVGVDAFDRRGARERCLRRHPDYGFPEQRLDVNAFAAIEIALWDLLGKRARLPLYALLGGPARAQAPFVAYAYAVDPQEVAGPAEVPGKMAEVARDALARSAASMFEFKVGVHRLEVEIAVVRAVRDALGPQVALAVDANMGFTPDEAGRFLTEVAGCRLANVEEPVAGLAALAALRRRHATPVSTHCVDLDALAHYPEIDAIVPDVHGLGGIGPTVNLVTAAAAAGRRVWLRSMWELGVSWAVMCHLGLALPALDRPAQCLIDWVADDLVEGEMWLVRDGGVHPPDAPGLGVDLDRAALARYRTDR